MSQKYAARALQVLRAAFWRARTSAPPSCNVRSAGTCCSKRIWRRRRRRTWIKDRCCGQHSSSSRARSARSLRVRSRASSPLRAGRTTINCPRVPDGVAVAFVLGVEELDAVRPRRQGARRGREQAASRQLVLGEYGAGRLLLLRLAGRRPNACAWPTACGPDRDRRRQGMRRSGMTCVCSPSSREKGDRKKRRGEGGVVVCVCDDAREVAEMGRVS